MFKEALCLIATMTVFAWLCVFSVLTKIIKTGYAALQLEYFFTAGPDEVRAWTVRVSVVE